MSEQSNDQLAPPKALRATGFALLGALLAGAFYLIWARGEAIMLDLAALSGKMWCF